MSLSYNTAVTIFGGFAPAILTWISYATRVSNAPALYVMAASVTALLAGLRFKTVRGPAPVPSTVSLS
jgi:MHS family proline/betaine transporter-like MFS transporter